MSSDVGCLLGTGFVRVFLLIECSDFLHDWLAGLSGAHSKIVFPMVSGFRDRHAVGDGSPEQLNAVVRDMFADRTAQHGVDDDT